MDFFMVYVYKILTNQQEPNSKDMQSMGIKSVEVNLQGPGSGRDSVVRAFQGSGLHVSVLRDVTPLPHNGTRPPKKRRV